MAVPGPLGAIGQRQRRPILQGFKPGKLRSSTYSFPRSGPGALGSTPCNPCLPPPWSAPACRLRENRGLRPHHMRPKIPKSTRSQSDPLVRVHLLRYLPTTWLGTGVVLDAEAGRPGVQASQDLFAFDNAGAFASKARMCSLVSRSTPMRSLAF